MQRSGQRWNLTTKYVYSSTIVQIQGTRALLEYFHFNATLYFTTSQRQILYFLLHYICLTGLVTLQITVFYIPPVKTKYLQSV